ncbi:hypothetical protein D1BOALGB6SA_2454, partial [Olavius sp. associated proteobacterium Delta 1]
MDHNNFTSLVKKFERSLKVLNRSNRTIREVIRKLNKFFDYLQSLEIAHVDGITREIVKDYQIEVYQTVNAKGYPNTVAYQNSMLSAVRQFLQFLVEDAYIVSNPSRDIQYAKQPQRLPSGILSASEARKILQAPDTK